MRPFSPDPTAAELAKVICIEATFLAEYFFLYAQVNSQTESFLREVVQPKLKRNFKRDEFLGRIDEMVVFHPFSENELLSIASSELDSWRAKAWDRHKIDMWWSPALAQSLTLVCCCISLVV